MRARGGDGGAQQSATAPPALVREARPIGREPRFHPPARGPVVGACRPYLGLRHGVHVEIFAANRVVLVAAGLGTKPPLQRSEGRIVAARCYGSLVTLEPTGVVLGPSRCGPHVGGGFPRLGPAVVEDSPVLVCSRTRPAGGGVCRRAAVGRPPGGGAVARARRDRARGRPARTPPQPLHVSPRGLSGGRLHPTHASAARTGRLRRRAATTRDPRTPSAPPRRSGQRPRPGCVHGPWPSTAPGRPCAATARAPQHPRAGWRSRSWR